MPRSSRPHNVINGRSTVVGLILASLIGCSHVASQPASPIQATLDPTELPGVYQLIPASNPQGSQADIEALLLKKDGSFNIVFSKMEYGYYTVGKWTTEGSRIHLFPGTVDQKDRAKTESDLQSGKIPSKERAKLELMLQDRLLTPIFDHGSGAPRLRVDSPQLEELIEPDLGSGTIYLTPQSK